MGDRRRKAGSVESSQDLAVWSSIRVKLAALTEIQAQAEETLSSVEELQSRYRQLGGTLFPGDSDPVKKEEDTEDNDLADDDKEDEKIEVGQKLQLALDKLATESEQEKSIASETLESLSILVALRTPDQLQVNDGGKRKKRRLEASSPGLSDASGVASARASPAPALSASTGSANMSRRGSRNPDVAQHPAVTGIQIPPHTGIADSPASGAQTPGGTRILTKKERKDILSAQLPLKEGRFVAFRPPPKHGQPKNVKQEAGSTDWIQARIVRCILGDKNRYEVQDVDDADGAEGTPGERYNTTLKAILVLPDPRDKSTYPSVPYPTGSDVIALYPDTTSFYRAKVVATPTPGKSPKYKLVFEDDDGAVRSVSVDHVVDIP